MKIIVCALLLSAPLPCRPVLAQPVPSVYTVDTKHSTLKWTGYYLFNFGEHSGTVDVADGQIAMHEGQLTGFVLIDMKTVKNSDMPYDNGGKDLADHLMSKDFFESDRFPTARIELTKTKLIADAGENEPNYEITGNLSIKGQTQPISFPARVTFQGSDVSVTTRFKFDRTKWGVHYNSGKIFSDVGDGAISDAIAIDVNLKGTR